MRLSRVVFPLPLGPISTTNEPRITRIPTPRRAVTLLSPSSNVRSTPAIVMMLSCSFIIMLPPFLPQLPFCLALSTAIRGRWRWLGTVEAGVGRFGAVRIAGRRCDFDLLIVAWANQDPAIDEFDAGA